MADNTLLNFVKETIKTNSEITATYTELVDLGTDYTFRALLIYNTLDEDVIVKFTNVETVEKYIPAGVDMGFDFFRHNDVIEIKHLGSAPNAGKIIFTSWRAE